MNISIYKETGLLITYMIGGDLFDRISCRKKYSEESAKLLVQNLLSAISYLHSKNIAHR